MYQNTHIKFVFRNDDDGTPAVSVYLNRSDIIEMSFNSMNRVLKIHTKGVTGLLGPGYVDDLDMATGKPKKMIEDPRDPTGPKVPRQKETPFSGNIQNYTIYLSDKEVISQIMRQWDPEECKEGVYLGFQYAERLQAKMEAAIEQKKQDAIEEKNRILREQEGRVQGSRLVDETGNTIGTTKEEAPVINLQP